MAISTEQRFWSKVDKNGPTMPHMDTPCWIWTAAKRHGGYGSFSLRHGRTVGAHRHSLQTAMGIFGEWLDAGFEAEHRCLNRACVRPRHLRSATKKQNMENLQGARQDSKSGVRGVYWDTEAKKWHAKFQHSGRTVHVGRFATIADAEAAVIAARNEVFTHNDVDRQAS